MTIGSPEAVADANIIMKSRDRKDIPFTAMYIDIGAKNTIIEDNILNILYQSQ